MLSTQYNHPPTIPAPFDSNVINFTNFPTNVSRTTSPCKTTAYSADEFVDWFKCIRKSEWKEDLFNCILEYKDRHKFLDSENLFGKWNDFIFNANWTNNKKKGYFKLWVNGKLVYHFKGKTIGSNDAAIHQLGIYRGEAKNSNEANHVVYYDQMKIAKSCKKINLNSQYAPSLSLCLGI